MKSTRSTVIAGLLYLALSLAGAAQEPFSFVQVCDPQLCRYGCEHDAATFSLSVEYINALRPDFVLVCGDLTDMTKSADTLQDFLDIRSDLEMPCYCMVGNNDVGNTPSASLLEIFRTRVGPDWFAVDHKGYTFIGVNTSLWKSNALPAETAAQDAWLLQQLSEAHAAGRPVVVAGHYPLFLVIPDEAENGSNLPVAKRTELLNLFQENGVVAYLAGHTHSNFLTTYNAIQFVTSASTCGNYDSSPLGFRVWQVSTMPPSFLTSQYVGAFDFYTGRDSDGDGLPDAQEDANRNNIVDPGETDRLNPDTDGDGINDGTEITFGLNPLVPDLDVHLPTVTVGGAILLIAILLMTGSLFAKQEEPF